MRVNIVDVFQKLSPVFCLLNYESVIKMSSS